MSPKFIAVVGTVNIDTSLIVKRVPDAGESVKAVDYRQSTGGKGANAAISSFRSCHDKVPAIDGNPDTHNYISAFGDDLDISVGLVAAIGNDSNGDICKSNLEENGIMIHGIRVAEGQMTGMSVCVIEEEGGQNRIISHRGANNHHGIEDFPTVESLGGGTRPDLLIIHLTLPLPVVESILEIAGQNGVEIVLNAAPAQLIPHDLYRYVTHLIINETEAAILSGQDPDEINVESCPRTAKTFLRRGVKNVVITLGEYGAYYAQQGAENTLTDGHVPANKVSVVDTTGAGDTFVGTYASSYIQQKHRDGWNIEQAVVRAGKASARTIGTVGAQTSIPWSNEIDSLVCESEPVVPEIDEMLRDPDRSL